MMNFELALDLFSPLGNDIREKREHEAHDEKLDKTVPAPINPDIQLVINGQKFDLRVTEHVAQVRSGNRELVLKGVGESVDA